jgi:hypothetical protein
LAILKLPAAFAMLASILRGIADEAADIDGGWAADRYGLNTMNLIPRVLVMIASTYGKKSNRQRFIVAGSRIQSVGPSEQRPHRCALCARSYESRVCGPNPKRLIGNRRQL